MKLPESINVKGVVYQIIKTDTFPEEGNLEGLCDLEKKIIYVKKSLKTPDLKKAFLHELFHAVLFEVGVHCTEISEDLEHIIVENLSNFVVDSFSIHSK